MRNTTYILLFLIALPISLLAQELHVAAYYYPWYGSRHWGAGFIREQYDPPQAPLLGRYASTDRKVVRQHQAWSEAYGIDSWICSWWGRRKLTDRALRRGVLPELKGTSTQMAIFYESAGLLGMERGRIRIDEDAIQQLTKDMRYLAKHYFGHPNYLKIEGRPVLFIYLTRAFYGQVEAGLQALRDAARQEGHEVYLIGDEVFWGRVNLPHLQWLDAVTPYNMHGPPQYAGYPAQSGFFDGVERQYQQYQYLAKRYGNAFIPNAFPGFNDLGVRPEAGHYIIPPRARPDADADEFSTFREFLALARSYADPKLNMMTITSFNEWHEDTQVEPAVAAPGPQRSGTAAYGYGLLEVIRQMRE